MLKIAKLAGAAIALGVCALAAAPEAEAATWSRVILQSQSDYWADGAVNGQLWTGNRVTRFFTYAATNNVHRGGMFVYCNGQPFYGFPAGAVQYWTGNGLRNEYWCPGVSTIKQAQAWVSDN